MTRLFNASPAKPDAKKLAAEADRVLKEELALDAASDALGAKLSQQFGIQPIRYASYRMPGSKWMIEHAQVGDDYVYQLFPLRAIPADWRSVVVLLISAMDAIFPQSTQIQYTPPNERYQIKFFTVRVQKVATQPGWQDACQGRALRALASISI